jgi:hypothetical protein
VKIFPVNTNEYSGIRCLDSGSLILWDDEDIVDAIDGSCILAVVSSLCPENCAVGGLPLSEAWDAYYSENASESSLEEMIQNADLDAVALQVIRSGMACGPYHETTYFLIPSDLSHTQFCLANEEA